MRLLHRSGETKQKRIDMLHGPLLKKIVLFAIPIALGGIMQQLFNTINVAVVGQFAGSEALAAVGANGPVVNLLVNLFIGISIGANVAIAHYIAIKNSAQVQKAVHTSYLFAILCGIGLMIVGVLAAREIMVWIYVPENVLDLAAVYLQLYCLGMPFIMIYNFAAAALRSIGDTRRPLYALLVGGVLTAAFSLLFVAVFHWDVVGVALATDIANVVSAAMVTRNLMQEKGDIRLDLKRLSIDKGILKYILRIGLPAGLQSVIFGVSNICIQWGINGFGAAAVAGNAAALAYEQISYAGIVSFGQAAVTFISQNFAVGQFDRCKRSAALSLGCAVVVTFILDALFNLIAPQMMAFMTSDPAVIEYGLLRFRYVIALQWIICSYEVLASCMRGYGYSLTPTLIMIVGTCLFRIAWLYTVLVWSHEFLTLMFVYPASWVLTASAVVAAYFITSRRAFKKAAAI